MARIVFRESWVPNPGGQARFMASRALISALLAGYGAGKTQAGARKALRLACWNAGRDGMIVAPTWGTLRRVTLRAFHDKEAPDAGVCPREFIADVYEKERYLLLRNGSRVYYGSADRPGSLEGTNLAWWWLDEGRLVRSAAWKILVGRLRDARARRLQGLITSTPAAGWLQDEFGSEKPGREVFRASTRENAAHLPPGFIADLERTYSAREARVYIDGEFGLLVGAVYEEFDRRHHLVDWKYDPRLRTLCSVDFGYRRSSVGFWQQLPAGWPIPDRGRAPAGGAYVRFDEIAVDDTPTPALAKLIVQKGYQLAALYCDPAGDSANVDTGLSSVKELKENGLGQVPILWQTAPRWRHVPTGVGLVRGLLRNAAGETRLWLAKSLERPRAVRGAVRDLEGYRYPEARDGKPVSDEPVKDGVHDHGVDEIRYLAVNEIVRSGTLPGSVPAM